MRYNEFKVSLYEVEDATISRGNLLGIKQEILKKIESLPQDENSKITLNRVKELLDSNSASDNLKGFISRIEGIAVNDKDVAKAVDQLARLIVAVAQMSTPAERDFFFKLWEQDRLVDVDKLMKGDKVYSVNEIFPFYGKNNAVTYIVNALSRDDAGYGLGKGEVLLSVLSKRITKAEEKGDLIIDGSRIEVKTTDRGSPRFTDQEVFVGAGYEQVRDEIYEKYKKQIKDIGGKAISGYNLKNYIEIGRHPETDINQFKHDTELLLSKIFPKQDSRDIADAIVAGDFDTARILFANRSFERYMNVKNDDAVLYINLSKKVPTYVLFTSVDDLKNLGLILRPNTIYILGSISKNVYPQITVVNAIK